MLDGAAGRHRRDPAGRRLPGPARRGDARASRTRLEDLGLLPVSAEEALSPDSKVYTRWTLHSTSHMLGLDVHDCAAASTETYKHGPLKEGMVLTVEPGLYFQEDDLLVPEELRGIGIRIEDDIAGHRRRLDEPVGVAAPRARRRRGVDGGPPPLTGTDEEPGQRSGNQREYRW